MLEELPLQSLASVLIAVTCIRSKASEGLVNKVKQKSFYAK